MKASTPAKVSRPATPGYFRSAEEGTGLLPWEHACDQLAGAKNYWVVTTGSDLRPHAMPVWAIWNGREIVFSTSPASRKARNLGENPRAVVHLESGNQVVVLEGEAEEVRDPARLQAFLDAYNAKYSWDFRLDQLAGGGVWAVRPKKVFAWLDGQGEGFSGAATRWELD